MAEAGATDDAGSDGGFDPASMPGVASADPSLPGSIELGVFSLSLSVADLERSRDFYTRLGFEVTGGDSDSGWLILKNGESTLGLFSGMFERNMLTFNPGLTPRMERIESYTDVRDIAGSLAEAGIEVDAGPEGADGPGSIMLTDPDGNPILIDQFF